MMPEAAPPIEYASEAYDTPADRLLRHVVAWTALVYGGKAIIGTGLHVALAKGWVVSPSNMGWEKKGVREKKGVTTDLLQAV